MLSEVIRAAFEAKLSPIVCRVAVIVADIRGVDQALRFIDFCRREGEGRGLRTLQAEVVLSRTRPRLLVPRRTS